MHLVGWIVVRAGNKKQSLEERLEARFQPLFTTEAYLQPQANHVDNNVFGAVPLELYMQTKDEKYLAMGMKYADTQWDAPATQELTEEEKAWADKGYSWQTRLWMDDMFMITAVQAQAYRVTQDMKYITRAAREMVVYLDSLPVGQRFVLSCSFCSLLLGKSQRLDGCGYGRIVTYLAGNESGLCGNNGCLSENDENAERDTE